MGSQPPHPTSLVAEDWQPFMVGAWKVEPEQARLVRGSEIVKVDPRNVRLLRLLASRAGTVVSQSEIEQIVWSGQIISSDSIYQSIAQLRRALGESSEQRYIQTVPRRGYRLIASVDFLDRQESSQTSHVFAASRAAELVAPEMSQNVQPSVRSARRVALAGFGVVTMGLGAFALFDHSGLRTELAPPASPIVQVHRNAPATSELVELPAQLQGAASYRRSVHSLLELLGTQSANPSTEEFEIVRTLVPLARQALLAGDPLKSEEFARRGLKILDRLKQEVSPTRIALHSCLAQALRATHRFALAEQHLRQALAHSRQLNSDEHSATIVLLNQLALLRLAEGRYTEAEQEARLALASYAKLADRTTSFAAHVSSTLMSALIRQGRHDEAIEIGTNSLASLDPQVASEPYLIAITYHFLGEAMLRAGRPKEAEPLLQREIALLKSTPHPDADMARAQALLARTREHVTMRSESKLDATTTG